jgi:DinB superfamily
MGEGHVNIGRPTPSDYPAFYETYVSLVQNSDPIAQLEQQLEDTLNLLRGISETESQMRYAPDKWSLKQVLGHMIDTERVFSYRALWFARGDQTPLPGFDQNEFMENSRFDALVWTDLIGEFEFMRRANLLAFKSFDEAAWNRAGSASGGRFTTRAKIYAIAGHELHHVRIIREKYLGFKN